MTHSLNVSPQRNALGVAIACRGCSNPEPIDCKYVWIEKIGDVLFCGSNPLELFEFMLRHDVFKITVPGREFHDALTAPAPENPSGGVAGYTPIRVSAPSWPRASHGTVDNGDHDQ
jgi:hypothetical protein